MTVLAILPMGNGMALVDFGGCTWFPYLDGKLVEKNQDGRLYREILQERLRTSIVFPSAENGLAPSTKTYATDAAAAAGLKPDPNGFVCFRFYDGKQRRPLRHRPARLHSEGGLPRAAGFLPPTRRRGPRFRKQTSAMMFHPSSFDFTHQRVLGTRPWTEPWPNPEKGWDRAYLEKALKPVRDFQLRHGARIYVGEFSAICWAPGAENYLRDCIGVFRDYGWDWTYHAFREWGPWSVEHETATPGRPSVPAADTPPEARAARGPAEEVGRRRRVSATRPLVCATPASTFPCAP